MFVLDFPMKKYPLYFLRVQHGIAEENILSALVDFRVGEKKQKEKPMLALELDEHGADAGYMTRVEAFLDVLRSRKRENRAPVFEIYKPPTDWQKRRIFIPPMHELGPDFFAAAFRGFGFNAEALPPESTATLEEGRRLTRGSECLPTAATLGVLARVIKDSGLDPAGEALFMPTAEGPCRFGQYATCHRLALEKIGMGEAAILSPSSATSATVRLPPRLKMRPLAARPSPA